MRSFIHGDVDMFTLKALRAEQLAGKRASLIEMSVVGCSYMLRHFLSLFNFLSHAMDCQMKQFAPGILHEAP